MVRIQFLVERLEGLLTSSGATECHHTVNLPSTALDVHCKQRGQSTTEGMTGDANTGSTRDGLLQPPDHCRVDSKVSVLKAFTVGTEDAEKAT
jgi:hypothetical protein